MTEQFIEQHMRNENGTLATYLEPASSTDPDMAAGKEALSESLGLWMQYAVLQQDKQKFDESLTILKSYFLSPQHYIRWKLTPTGQSEVSTNALGDDLRIVDALLKAFSLWNEESYMSLAKEVSSTLQSIGMQNGYLVDFHDFKQNQSAQTLSLAYVDLSAMKGMLRNHLMQEPIFERHKNLLLDMPNDGVFYPKAYQIPSRQYVYDEQVNIIDQLIVGLHVTETGQKPAGLLAFLKREFQQHHQIMGQYTRKTRAPAVAYESPAVYGLAVMLALKCDDPQWAEQLEKRMLNLRDQNPAYSGGYVFNNNTHIFDNLLPLLAEVTLNNNHR
ncbi:glycosyl hydrolase family 8 [Paenibacillus dakarensis]|uniref:glycosyl hydrolase family 8 n=1 Tax=Paenibacillus dakarensis TaxID=1527293 RepID=UPI001FDF2F10|nr:glycosyl hydrolase family 8 [Paenibacillus dakarensis]